MWRAQGLYRCAFGTHLLACDLSPASEAHHLGDKTEHSKTFCSPYKVKSVFREQETEYRGIASGLSLGSALCFAVFNSHY